MKKAPAQKKKKKQGSFENLRIRFWGVQGSCPLFPQSNEVLEYERMIGTILLQKVLADMELHSRNGKGCNVKDLLGGPLTEKSVLAYQKRLGLSELPIYGGDTTCLSIETSDGYDIVLDGGSGIRNCSKFLALDWPEGKKREVFIFGSHEHLDHRSGLPFSQFCFVRPPFSMKLYGSFQFLNALDERYGIFSRKIGRSTYLDDPIDYRVMSANFEGYELHAPFRHKLWRTKNAHPWPVHDIREPIFIGKTKITAFDVYHGAVRCLGYKIEHGGKKFVFCTDHEWRHGADPKDPRQQQSQQAEDRLIENSMDADAAYFDGQYFRKEYEGLAGIGVTMPVRRVDWGHGCIEDVVARARHCRVKHAFIGHHDPERSWLERLQTDEWLTKQNEGQQYKIELAKSEYVVDL